MHRQGLLLNEVDQAFNIIKNNSNIILEGICSHFSDSDGVNNDFTLSQIKTWNDLVDKTKKIFPEIKYVHISNTYGHRYSDKINANTSRLGIGLYGLANIDGLDLNPFSFILISQVLFKKKCS
jgi:alanine racemase